MGLGFLVPAFLAGLAALVVPILIHLRHREWERPRRFPSLMFLRRIPIRTARRRRITDWLLLLLRAAAIAVLVAAFARPFFRADPALAGGPPARAVAVLLDRSLSMSHREVWPAALDSARRVVQGLGPADRVAVIRFDDRAEVAQPLTADRAAALAAIGSTRPTARGTRYAAALRAGRQALTVGQLGSGAGGQRVGGEIVVITDLQRSGLGSGGTGGLAGLELPAGVEVRVVPVVPGARGNVTVLGAEIQRTVASGDRSELLVAARVAGRELGGQRRVRLSLTVEGRAAGSREVTLRPDGVVDVSFDRVPLGSGRAHAVIALDQSPDPLPGDDTLRLVVPPEAGLRVLLVVPAGARAEETLFLERALGIGRDPRFVVERKQVLDPAALRNAAVVILFDLAPTSGRGALDQWVRDGGGLIIAAGARLGGRTVSLRAGTVQGMAERLDDRGGAFGDVSLEHPVFAPFRTAGSEGSGLGSARFLRYPRIAPLEGSRVVARFDDGNPALLEQTAGSGRILLVAAPLDNLTGDFPLQPAYLPFLRRLASYAAGLQVAPLWRLAGETGIVPQTIREAVIATPAGALLRPVVDSGPRTVTLDEAGYYQTYSGRAAGEPLDVVAVNPPPAESDLTPADPRELLIGVRQDSSAAGGQAAPVPAEQEARQRVWRWLVLAAAGLLMLEAVVANRGWRGTASFVLPSPAAPERSSS